MARVRVVTDSSAELTPEIANELDITILPMHIRFGDEEFQDGIDLTHEEFYRRLDYSGIMPVAMPPSFHSFQETYKRLSDTTDQIISIHVSSRLNRVCRMAGAAAEAFLGRCQISVIDTASVSIGQGTLVKAAARAAQEDLPLDTIVRLIRGMIPHVYLVFFVEALDYLEREGRIGKAQALLGGMLNIKPILIVEDGDIIPLEKVRGRQRAVDKLFEFVAEFAQIEELAILQVASEAETAELIERLEQVFPAREYPVYQYGPVLASHIGPHTMGIVVYEGIY
jgi:DegV family protein with EDD domain